MASNRTSNYGLNQWEAGDKVIREEFNADNAKIDGALGKLAAGQLRMATGTYQGDGTYSLTVEFPFPPKFLYIQKMHVFEERFIWADGESVISLWADDCVYCKRTGDGHTVTFNGNTMNIETHVLVHETRRATLNQDNLWYFYLVVG